MTLLVSRRRVPALTGISAEEWEELARAFPGLPENPGPRAARRRVLLARLAAFALRTGLWPARLEGEEPSAEPAVYVTAHVGSLQALRYCLRARGAAVASVLGPHNLHRPEAERQDRIFDRRHPSAYPHFFTSSRVHRLRTALRSGSLLAAADLPQREFREVSVLGGTVRIDPRPFRLARAIGVPCRPAFLTLPGTVWRLTLGPRLPADADAALAGFVRCFQDVAERSPLDLDGVVYLDLARRLARRS